MAEAYTSTKDTKYLPYQLHVTVTVNSSTDFVIYCKEHDLKPLALKNFGKGKSYNEYLTSSGYKGDVRGARRELDRIVSNFTDHGWKVVRKKIETVPWHPSAESPFPSMYFEAHINIDLKDRDGFTEVASKAGLNLSRNLMKSDDRIIGTIRQRGTTRSQFDKKVEKAIEILYVHGFVAEKLVTEFAIFDSNPDLDKNWLTEAK